MITSTANQQIKNLIQLQKKAKARKEQDVFIAEGLKMFLEAPIEKIEKIYVSESFLAGKSFREIEGREKAENGGRMEALRKAEVLEDRIFEYVSDTKTPQGILCIVKQRRDRLEDIIKKENPLIMVLENLQDPGNLGTIVRTAEGAGVSAVLMSAGTADLYNPKTIRSTMGSIYRIPCIVSTDLPGDIGKLKHAGVTVYAAHLKGTQSYSQADYRGGTAFLIGNEGNGLTDETAELADRYIRIPMCGQVESLNAAVASSILMYEVLRQRSE